MHSQPSRPSSLLGGCGGGCSVLSSPVAGWKTRSTVGEAYCEVAPRQRAWETPIKPYVYIGAVIYKCAFSCLKACAPPMPLCFFIRRTADSNRIARTGSLLRVEGEGNRREIEKCACVHFHLIGCSSLELGILLILRYFLSMLTQLCTHTVYGCAPWLRFISNALNLTLGKFIVIHFTVIQGALRDCPSLQPRLSWQDCVCHTSARTHTHTNIHTNLLFQHPDGCSPPGKGVCWLDRRMQWDGAVCLWLSSTALSCSKVQISGE